MAGGFITNSSPFVDSTFTWPVAGPGEGSGGLAPTSLFLDKTDARRAEKNFFWRPLPPLSKGLNDRPPPLISKSGSGTDGTTCF